MAVGFRIGIGVWVPLVVDKTKWRHERGSFIHARWAQLVLYAFKALPSIFLFKSIVSR